MDKIYIPTFRRVESQITFDSLPDKYKEKNLTFPEGCVKLYNESEKCFLTIFN